MSLSDTKVKNAKAREKQYKLMDDLGLYVLVKENGSRLWRFDYQFNGKRKTLALGKYPAVSLAEARLKRDDARNLLSNSEDPSVKQRLDKITEAFNAENTFGKLADELLAKMKTEGKAQSTIDKKDWFLKTLASDLSKRPITDIKAPEILHVVKQLERRGINETAQRVQRAISEVFRLAVITSRVDVDVTQSLKGAVAKKPTVSHPAIIDEKEFGHLAWALDEYDGWPVVRLALKMITLTVARPIELRKMRRSDIDRKNAIWTIPKGTAKMRREHKVPLSTQALAILDEIEPITYRSEFVFELLRGAKKPISETSMNIALRRMGYEKTDHVPHGFRTSFSTIMNERGHNPELIEHSLAHVEKSVRAIYNRAKYLEPRRELLQTWADLVDTLKSPDKSAEASTQSH